MLTFTNIENHLVTDILLINTVLNLCYTRIQATDYWSNSNFEDKSRLLPKIIKSKFLGGISCRTMSTVYWETRSITHILSNVIRK